MGHFRKRGKTNFDQKGKLGPQGQILQTEQFWAKYVILAKGKKGQFWKIGNFGRKKGRGVAGK